MTIFLKVRLWLYSRSTCGDRNFTRVLCESTLKSTKDLYVFALDGWVI